MQSFEYQRVYSLQEALNEATTSKGPSAFMAGGTDLLVQIKEGKRQPHRIIDLKGIHEMDGVTLSGNDFFIGALTSIRALETSPSVLKKLPLLAQARKRANHIIVARLAPKVA